MSAQPTSSSHARIHAEFVTLHEEKLENDTRRFWKPVSEWEQAIWGWAVVNYTNRGLQFFTSDGHFYREIRLGGPANAASVDWTRGQAKTDTGVAAKQLDKLLGRLKDKDHLQVFFDMVNGFMENMGPAPEAFGDFFNALSGQPLALVNMGWSVELGINSSVNQFSPDNFSLTSPPASIPESEHLPKPKDELTNILIKFGESNKSYDGLAGYWNQAAKPASGDALNLDTLFTYYISKDAPKTGPVKLIEDNNLPTLQPYHLDPKTRNPEEYSLQQSSKMKVFGAILDPFRAVHGFIKGLPVKELKLSPWTWQTALQNIKTFFHMGPLILQNDAKPENGKPENAEARKEPRQVGDSIAPKPVPAPEWAWLQPTDGKYPFESDPRGLFRVAPVAEESGSQSSPCTSIEGYLQLKGEQGGST